MNLKNLLTRTLSGIVFVAVVLGAMWWGPMAFLALVCFIAVGSMWEFFRLAPGNTALRIYPTAVGVMLIGLAFTTTGMGVPMNRWAMLPAAVALIPALELFRNKEQPLTNVAQSLLAIFYIALPLALWACMGVSWQEKEGMEWNWQPPMAFVILIWTNDVFAYLTGITLGKHRLFERISPKKSWEGFFGGLILTAVAGWFLAPALGLAPVAGIGAGVIISLAGVAGDLVESMFKRAAGVKDSGAILPGHGGLLDRFDALFIASPFLYLYLNLLT